jgi:hypothetical protein
VFVVYNCYHCFNQGIVERKKKKKVTECAASNIFFTVSSLYSDYVRGFRGKPASPTKYSGILVLVPGIFLIVGAFKSPDLNAFPKFELLKTLSSFSRPWTPTSISVKQQFASATPNEFTE